MNEIPFPFISSPSLKGSWFSQNLTKFLTTFHSHFSQRVSMQLGITARFPAGKVVLVEIMEFYIPVFCSNSLQAQTH